MRPLDIVLLVLVQIIWGANYAVQKDAIAAFPPLLLVGIAVKSGWPEWAR